MKSIVSLVFILMMSVFSYAQKMDSISDTILIEEVKDTFRKAEKLAVKKVSSGKGLVLRNNEYSCNHYLKRIDEWLKGRSQTNHLLDAEKINAKNVSDIISYWSETLGLGDNLDFGSVEWSWNIGSTEDEMKNSLMIINYGMETGNNIFSDFMFVDPAAAVTVENNKLNVTMPLSLLDVCSNTKFRLLAIKNCSVLKIEDINSCDVSDSELFIGSLQNFKDKLNKTKKKRSRYEDAVGNGT